MVFGSRASWFVSLCLAACVVLLLGLGTGCAGRVEVPDVGGYPLAEATTLIEEAGLAVGEVEYAQHKGRAANEVIRSEPEAGSRVSPGDLIDLVVVADEAIARVNGEEIGRAELDEQIERLREQSPELFQDDTDGSVLADFRHRLFESLIDTLLVRQEVVARGIAVSAEEIDEAVDEYRVGYGGETEFESALRDMNRTIEELREQIEEQLANERLMEQLTVDTIVSAAEVERYYQANRERFAQAAAIRPSHILFGQDDQETARRVLGEIRAGGDFAALARQHSVDPGSASAGGDLDWQSAPYPWVEEFNSALSGLRVGEVSDLVRTEFGWHIITITEEREGSIRSLSEATEEIESMIRQQRDADAYQVFLDDLRARADIEILDETLSSVR